jgi:uncharacterized membrane protein
VSSGRRLRGNEDGAVLPIVALSLVFLMTMTAFTIDLGRVMLSNRDLQKVSDLVALDLARRVDGVRTVTEINADPTFQLQKLISASRNGFDITGARRVDHHLGVIDRRTREFHELHGSSVPNAVEVVAGDAVDYFFFPGSSSTSRGAAALARGNATCIAPDPLCPLIPDDTPPGGGGTTTTLPGVTTTLPGATTTTLPDPCMPPTICQLTAASADFEAGSFLASASLSNTQVQLLNGLFSAVGTGVNFDVLSYQGLANAQLTARQLATALGLASPDNLFTTTITYKNFLLASANAIASNGGPAAAVTALNVLAQSVNPNTTIDVSNLMGTGSGFYAGQGNSPSGFDTYLKFFNLLQGSAFLINGNNAISVPNLAVGIAGFTRVDASFKAVEGVKQLTKAHVGDQLLTSQLDLTLTITLDIDNSGHRAGERIRGTLVVHPVGGSAVASPSLIVCPNTPGPAAPQVRITVVGSPVTTTGNAALTMSVASIDVLRTNIPSASITSAGQSGTATFMYPNEFEPSVGTGGTKRVSNPSLNLSAGFSATSGNSSVLGIPLIPVNTLINEANAGLSSSVFSKIQDTIVPLVTSTIGIELGGADVGVFGIECTETLLVH